MGDNFPVFFFLSEIFLFLVAMSDQVQDMQLIHDLCIQESFLKYGTSTVNPVKVHFAISQASLVLQKKNSKCC